MLKESSSFHNMVAAWAKNSSFSWLIFHWQMDEKNRTFMDNQWRTVRNHIGTLWEYIYTLQVVSFLVLAFLGQKKTYEIHFMHLCTPCDIISMKTTSPSGRAHPQLHCVKIWSQSNWWFLRYWQFYTPPVPVAVQTHTASMSTSPDMPPMAYQVPVHVPFPTYNWAASDQMQEFCLFKCQLET